MNAIIKAAALGVLSLISPASAKAQTYDIIRTQGQMNFITVPAAHEADLDHYLAIIAQECRRGRLCILHFFADRAAVSFPMSDADLAARTAVFNRNPNTGLEQFLFACRLDQHGSYDCLD